MGSDPRQLNVRVRDDLPDRADAWAGRIATSLRPATILLTGEDAELRAALEDRGIAVIDAADRPNRVDLVLLAGGGLDRVAAEEVLQRHAGQAAHVLLVGDGGRVGLLDWLRVAQGCGLQPVLSYDAGFFGADAVLLGAAAEPLNEAMLAMCAEVAQARHAFVRREQALVARTAALRAQMLRAEKESTALGANGFLLAEKLRAAEASLAVVRHERDAIRGSTIWRATGPLRHLMNRLAGRGRAGGQAAPAGSAYQEWVAEFDTLDDADRAAIRRHMAAMVDAPLISVVMPVYDTPADQLRAAVASVRAQLYPRWELCIADDGSPAPHVGKVLAELAKAEPRVRVVRLAVNGNISAATNAALGLATGEFVALMDHDDLLPEHALYCVAAELQAHPDADLIYSDEDQIDGEGRRALPYFKPDFNVELMLGHNMVSHLGVYRRSLLMQLGGARLGLEGSQDYDIALRAVAATAAARIRHIPAVLYHWRQHRTSFSQSRIDACVQAARRAIGDYLEAAGLAPQVASIGPTPAIPTWTRVQWVLPEPAPMVSVIVPTRDGAAMLRACADGVLRRTDYPDLELIVVDNDSRLAETASLLRELQQDPRVRVLRYPGAFNYSAMNNRAAAMARGQMLALLNNDIDVVEPGWLAEMVSQAARPGVGAVGARLLYADGRVQHTGVVLGVGTFDGGPGVAGHFSLAEPGGSFGYFGASVMAHEVSAVTAACMVLSRAAFDAVGGLDEVHLPVAFNDVDFCLRLRAAGMRIVLTPFAELYHRESATRGNDLAPEHRARFDAECRYMRERWGAELDNDPFYNPNFSRMDGLFRVVGPSRRQRPWAAYRKTPED